MRTIESVLDLVLHRPTPKNRAIFRQFIISAETMELFTKSFIAASMKNESSQNRLEIWQAYDGRFFVRLHHERLRPNRPLGLMERFHSTKALAIASLLHLLAQSGIVTDPREINDLPIFDSTIKSNQIDAATTGSEEKHG